jgi:hypothetical protein
MMIGDVSLWAWLKIQRSPFRQTLNGATIFRSSVDYYNLIWRGRKGEVGKQKAESGKRKWGQAGGGKSNPEIRN